MSTEAQIIANRHNAQRSTGPRTRKGKSAISQNAVKHGLLARQAVISSENQDEFDLYRNWMLAELAPAGPMESMLAERIVSLSWRLKRRIMNQTHWPNSQSRFYLKTKTKPILIHQHRLQTLHLVVS